VSERAQLLLPIADDELVLGWRNSEWTGIAPFLEEDVAFSSIAQNEIGHARALYEVVAAERGVTADEVAFDRAPEEYRSSPFVELDLMHDWARTIARRILYEAADTIRVAALRESPSPELAGLAEKIEREEAYHRLHAEMWTQRLRASEEGKRRLDAALDELWPYALGLLDGEGREELCRTLERDPVEAVERGAHAENWPALWEEMTIVRRSAPGSAW
jgi:ring-1,2-phenylacetyl-CoA epoxidase subunit PaaC